MVGLVTAVLFQHAEESVDLFLKSQVFDSQRGSEEVSAATQIVCSNLPQVHLSLMMYFQKLFIYFFIWLVRVLVVACRIILVVTCGI